jgi:tape measure domain-containing protein
MKVGSLWAELGLDARGFKAGLKEVKQEMEQAHRAMKAFHGAMATLVSYVGIQGARAFSEMAAEIESMNRRILVSTGSIEKNERAWRFLRKTSKDLGLSIEDLADRYGSLAAATLSSGMSTEDLETLFTAVSQKAAILGMSNMRVRLTFLALEQMASKGVVSMEELRRQFGENIPGAMGIMARALRVSTAELNDWVKTGKLASDKALPLLATQLLKENAPALETLTDSTQMAINAFKSAFFELKNVLSESIFTEWAKNFNKNMASVVRGLTTFVEWLNKVEGAQKAIFETLERERPNQYLSLKDRLANMFVATGVEGGEGALGISSGGVGGYVRALETIKDAVEETIDETKGLTEEQIQDQVKSIREDLFGNMSKEAIRWSKEMASNFNGVLNEFNSFLVKFASGADVTFKDLINNIGIQILNLTTKLLVLQPILVGISNAFANIYKGSLDSEGGPGFLLNFASKVFGMPAPSLKAENKYADGGIINEPVFGIGAKSKSSYLIGEAGPEAVVPADQMGGGGANVTVNIKALDSKSVASLLKSNPQAITGPIVSAIQKGDRGLTSSLRMAVS